MSEAEQTYTPDEARIYLEGYNAALRAQEQNEPLTLEQLLEMDGKPVFIGKAGIVNENKWHIITLIEPDKNREYGDEGYVFTVSDEWNFTDEDVEIGWVECYAHEPKGADK